MNGVTCDVAILGAGPYGLSAAAHLRAAKMDVRVFGEAMEYWDRQMPSGMLLRSDWEACHISDPHGELTLDAYQRVRGAPLPMPVSLEDFVAYGQWFQRKAVPDLDRRRVARIDAADKGFRLRLADGETVCAQRVVIAVGLGAFARRPALFDGLPSTLASHTSEHRDLSRFAGQRVVVVGGGQSALESAALLHEAGADVEVLMRAPRVHWLRYGSPLHAWLHSEANPIRRILYPPSNIGPPGLNWIVDTPDLFKRLPRRLQPLVKRRTIRPAGAGWLRPRIKGVLITTGRVILSADGVDQQVRLKLDDGTERRVDHALLATGYRVDISRWGFLAPELEQALRLVDGYPHLTAGFETSLPGLYCVGPAAVGSFGPLMGFVAGTKYASRALTPCILSGHLTSPAWGTGSPDMKAPSQQSAVLSGLSSDRQSP